MDVLSLTDVSARLGFIAQTLALGRLHLGFHRSEFALGRLHRPDARTRPCFLAQTPQ